MLVSDALEKSFLYDYLKILDDEIKNKTDFIVEYPHEPNVYAQNVGYLRALKDQKETFERLLKSYYGS